MWVLRLPGRRPWRANRGMPRLRKLKLSSRGSNRPLHRSRREYAIMSRHQAPVFVVGCPRSGTTLLYNMLLSAGGFAVYLAESNVFNMLGPRFGNLAVRPNSEKLADAWLDSNLFRAFFMDREPIRQKIVAEAQSEGEFISVVMGEMARQQ